MTTRGAPDEPVNWGDFGLTPISDRWGVDRGVPVDRHYIESFLLSHRDDIKGRVLEVKDSGYTQRIGGASVVSAEVIDIDPSNTRATIVADLTREDQLPENRFDCFILTQTLHI